MPESEHGIFNAILRGHIDFTSDPWPSISMGAKDLVKKMLNIDPKQRLTAIQVLSEYSLNKSMLQKIGFVLTEDCTCFTEIFLVGLIDIISSHLGFIDTTLNHLNLYEFLEIFSTINLFKGNSSLWCHM